MATNEDPPGGDESGRVWNIGSSVGGCGPMTASNDPSLVSQPPYQNGSKHRRLFCRLLPQSQVVLRYNATIIVADRWVQSAPQTQRPAHAASARRHAQTLPWRASSFPAVRDKIHRAADRRPVWP